MFDHFSHLIKVPRKFAIILMIKFKLVNIGIKYHVCSDLLFFFLNLYGFSCRYFSSGIYTIAILKYSNGPFSVFPLGFCMFNPLLGMISLCLPGLYPLVPSTERVYHLGNRPWSLCNYRSELDAPCYLHNTCYIYFSWHLQKILPMPIYLPVSSKSYLKSGAI